MPTFELLELVGALAPVLLDTTALNQLSRPPLSFELVALQQQLQLEHLPPPLATRALLLMISSVLLLCPLTGSNCSTNFSSSSSLHLLTLLVCGGSVPLSYPGFFEDCHRIKTGRKCEKPNSHTTDRSTNDDTSIQPNVSIS